MNDIQLAKQGDETAIERLISECQPMIKSLCRQFFLTGLDSDDLMQEAMLGVIKAINTFDDKKNDNFKAYAHLCAQRKLISLYRMQTRRKAYLLNSLAIDNEGALITGKDSGLIVAISDEDFLMDMMNKESNVNRTQAIKSLLTEPDYIILTKYLSGDKYEKIAKDMHTTAKHVDNRLQAIKRILLKSKDKILKGD